MTDHSVEIDPKNWVNLKSLYSPDNLKNYIAHTTIDNYIRWFEQDSNVKHVKFFCLNGDFSDGTFVVLDRCCAFADTLNNSHENLLKLLQLIDYTKGYTFLSIRPEIRPVIHEVLKKLNVELLSSHTTLLYKITKDDALKFDVKPPKGITLRQVAELHDFEKANSVWPNSDPNSLTFFERMAKYNINVGAYKDDGTLVAWLFRLPTGLLGALQTDEHHYGHGYGSLVSKYVSKKIAEMGQDTYAGVREENTPSRALFEKLGFKSIGKIHWITTKITWTPADD